MLLGIPFFQPWFLDYEVSFVYSTLLSPLANLCISLWIFMEFSYEQWSLRAQTDNKTKMDIHLCNTCSIGKIHVLTLLDKQYGILKTNNNHLSRLSWIF